MLWVITVVYPQFTCDYWLRHIIPGQTEEFVRELDEGIKSLFQICVGINMYTWSNLSKERVCLPIKVNGCNLGEAEDWHFGQLLGTMLQFNAHCHWWTELTARTAGYRDTCNSLGCCHQPFWGGFIQSPSNITMWDTISHEWTIQPSSRLRSS